MATTAMAQVGAINVPTSGNIYFGYSLNNGTTGLTNSGTLNGWEGSLEGMVFPHVGLVADVSQQFGTLTIRGLGPASERTTSFLFGPRVSVRIGPVRPFVHALFGAAHLHEDAGIYGHNDETSYAHALGGGIDYRVAPRLSWRLQLDSLDTHHHNSWQDNMRFSTGLALRF